MARFRYRSLDADGRRAAGYLDEASEAAALDSLKLKGHLPIDVRPASWTTSLGRLERLLPQRPIDQKSLALMTRELARLVAAGISIERSFTLVARTLSHKGLAEIAGNVAAGLKTGASLAQALEASGGPFDSAYVGLVRAGESSGQLPRVLEQLATDLAQRERLRSSLVTAMIYPAILLVLALAALAVVLVYIVPEFKTLLGDDLSTLPWSTRFVVGLSDAVVAWGAVTTLILMALAGGLTLWLRRPANRRPVDRALLSLPLVGPALRRTFMARFCRIMGTLVESGIRIPQALGLAAEAIRNTHLRDAIAAARDEVTRGTTLAAALGKTGAFPAIMVEMTGAGEESGQLDRMFDDLAALYEDQAKTFIDRTLAIVEPVLILGLGALVGGIIISILTGVMSINDVALR